MVAELKLDYGVVQLTAFEFIAKHLERLFAGVFACNGGDDAGFRSLVGVCLNFIPHQVTGHGDGGLDKVSDNLLDITADVTNFGELSGLDFKERRLRELGKAAGDLGFANARGADHQDILRINFVAKIIAKLLAAPAIAQGDGDSAFRVTLADDVAVELGDDLAGGQVGHLGRLSTVRLPLV